MIIRLNIRHVSVGLVAWAIISGLAGGSCYAAENQLDLNKESAKRGYFDASAQINSLFYNPLQDACVVTSGSKTNSYDDIVISGSTSNEKLEEVTEKYGELAMDLQREWGTPWEVVFAQMYHESSVGTSENGIDAGVAANGYYNWLGITGKGGKYSIGEPFISSNGREWAQYETIENMIKDWAGEYIARNGRYDEAFSHLDPNSYDIRGFLDSFINVYAPSSDGNNPTAYVTAVMNAIEGSIKTVREKKNWPSSEELAKKEKIEVGGKHPITGGSTDDEKDASSSDVGGACVKLKSSPDYNSSGYKERIGNLHDFHQGMGYFSGDNVCGFGVSSNACGVMSLYAGFYMFSGEGLNDQTVFDGFKNAATSDGYFGCAGSGYPGESAEYMFGNNLQAYTNMNPEEQWFFNPGWDAIVEELKQGRKLILETGAGSISVFTHGSGHYELVDHYDAEKDMVYVFDPALDGTTMGKFSSRVSSSQYEYNSDDPTNGVYVGREVIEGSAGINRAISLSYDGCWNGGTSSNVCRETSGNDNGLKEGGMTYNEAVAFIKKYRDEAAKGTKYEYGVDYGHTEIGDGWVHNAGCKGGTLNNCSALTQWFVNNYTDVGPNFGSSAGSEYTDLLINTGGFEDGGQIPQVYAVFSTGCGTEAGDSCVSSVTGKAYNNHTGVILGIDREKGEVYTAEAGCSAGYNEEWPGVFVRTIDEMTDTGQYGYKYAYPGNKIKLGGSTLTEQEADEMFRTMSTPTYEEVEKVAKQNYGITGDDFIAVMGWVQNEGYWADWAMEVGSNPYLAYLSACAIINHIVESHSDNLLQEIANYPATYGGVYGESLVRSKAEESRDTAGALKAAYMAFTHLQPTILTCSGWYDGTSKVLYGPKTVNGESVYVW